MDKYQKVTPERENEIYQEDLRWLLNLANNPIIDPEMMSSLEEFTIDYQVGIYGHILYEFKPFLRKDLLYVEYEDVAYINDKFTAYSKDSNPAQTMFKGLLEYAEKELSLNDEDSFIFTVSVPRDFNKEAIDQLIDQINKEIKKFVYKVGLSLRNIHWFIYELPQSMQSNSFELHGIIIYPWAML